jgi:hypothetical protein
LARQEPLPHDAEIVGKVTGCIKRNRQTLAIANASSAIYFRNTLSAKSSPSNAKRLALSLLKGNQPQKGMHKQQQYSMGCRREPNDPVKSGWLSRPAEGRLPNP